MSTIIFDAIELLNAGQAADAQALLSQQHPNVTQEAISKALRDATAANICACGIVEKGYAEKKMAMNEAISRLQSAFPTFTSEQARRVLAMVVKDLR